jgi:glucose-6-phosphate dehydrogenase assembly protein OpcA
VAGAVVDRLSRAADPDEIESTIADLWREIGREGPIARALMSNLVVFGHATADVPVEEVAARHPSRVIRVSRTSEPPCDQPSLAATVDVMAYGPKEARYGVEHIALHAFCSDAALPSIIRRLMTGDVPTSVWWADDWARLPPLGVLIAVGRQFIYDSRGWTDVRNAVQLVQPIVDEARIDCADVNWRRLAPVRHALLQLADRLTAEDLQPAAIRIAHRRGDSALAWLIGGWLSARLGWPATASPPIEEREQEDDLAIRIGRVEPATTISLSARQLIVAPSGGPAYTLAVRHETQSDAVAAELENLSQDAGLGDALRALARVQ